MNREKRPVQAQDCNIDNIWQKIAVERASKWLFRCYIWDGFEYCNKAQGDGAALNELI